MDPVIVARWAVAVVLLASGIAKLRSPLPLARLIARAFGLHGTGSLVSTVRVLGLAGVLLGISTLLAVFRSVASCFALPYSRSSLLL